MALRWAVRSNAYYDSVKLMRVSEAIAAEPGVVRAAAVMATPLNVELLADDGLLPPGVAATPDDLLITVLGEDEAAAQAALARVDDLLRAREPMAEGIEASRPRTLEEAAARDGANLAVIAVPGPAAAVESLAALRAGLHVFLFSDNVPLQDEVRLKALAAEQDLLMMGPDCGTAILGGVGLGFANRVERGPVGIVGASGTGIQQICCLLDLAGVGIAQAIGTGGRDLSAEVGGSMTRRALRMLAEDDAVEVIAVISKPADEETARRLHDDMRDSPKPVVACLLGTTRAPEGNVRYATSLVDAARALLRLTRGRRPDPWRSPLPRRKQRAGVVCGLYSGGTLAGEATQILDGMGVRHHLLDLGADEYTRGRAHPMIDPRLRAGMLADLAVRGDVGAVLLDVVLGDLAHPDPAGALLPGIEALRGGPPVVAALVGSRRDPQGLERQRALLAEAGVLVFAANADAAHAAGRLVGATA